MKTTHHEKKIVLSSFIVPIGIIGLLLLCLNLFSYVAFAEGYVKDSVIKAKKLSTQKGDTLKVQVHKKKKEIPKEANKIIKSKRNAKVKPVAKSKTIPKTKRSPPPAFKAKTQSKSVEPEKVISTVVVPTVLPVVLLKPQEIIESTSQSFIKIYASPFIFVFFVPIKEKSVKLYLIFDEKKKNIIFI